MNRNLNYPRRKFQEYADSGEIQHINIGDTIDDRLAVVREELDADLVPSLKKMYLIPDVRIGGICIVSDTSQIFMNISGVNKNATDWKDISTSSALPALALGIMMVKNTTTGIEFTNTIQSGTF